MSVPVPKRDSGELEVNTKARSLTVYTFQILANPKWFPQSQAAFIGELQKVKSGRRKYRRLVAKAKRGEVPRENVDASFATWIDHLSKGNSKKLIARLTDYYNDLWRD